MSPRGSRIRETSFDSSASTAEAHGGGNGSPTKPIGLVLAGHHPLTLCGLTQAFEKEADCSVLAVCAEPEAALDAVRRHQADVLILDLDRGAVFKLLRRLQRERLPVRPVVLTSASDDGLTDALQLGARAIVLKELPPEAFVSCVRRVHAEPYRDGGPSAARVVSRLSRPASAAARHGARPLTPRETEIARLALLGISTREIAERLDVKQGTVKIHLHSIYEKLNVGGRLGLVLFARRQGLA